MYLQLAENIRLCGTNYDEYLMYIYQDDEMNYQEINKEAFEILSLCDGSNSYKDIVDKLSIYYDEAKSKVEENIIDFVNLSLKLGIIKEIKEKSMRYETKLEENLYIPTPLFMTLELTKKCNLNCWHCYTNAGIQNTKELNLNLLKDMISYAEQTGTLMLQFTGGETFMYSNIDELLEFTLENFSRKIEISTNGTIWNSIIEKILLNKNYSHRVSFQVSIDGLEEFHDSFRGMQGSYKKTVSFIKKIKEINPNIFVTVAITLANQEYSDILKLSEVISNLDVDRLRIGVVTDMGRAEGKSLLKWNVNQYHLLLHDLFKKYEDKKMQIAYETDDECKNCGAGHKIIAVLSDGSLTPCIMHKKKIGKLSNIDDFKRLMIKSIVETKDLIPPNRKYCTDCKYSEECKNCYANAEINRTKVNKCTWHESTKK